MNGTVSLLFLVACWAAVPCAAQRTRVSPLCDLAATVGGDAEQFHRFDHDLRWALERRDAGAVALLMSVPVQVNTARGRILLRDPGTIAARFDEILPKRVREAVAATRVDSISCSTEGVMYGAGLLWVRLGVHGYEVFVVNAGGPEQPRVDGGFVCRTAEHRVVIDGTEERPRLRLWGAGSVIGSLPEIEAAGELRWEGSGVCRRSVWKFVVRQGRVEVSELGCSEGPAEGLGELRFTPAGGSVKRFVCR